MRRQRRRLLPTGGCRPPRTIRSNFPETYSPPWAFLLDMLSPRRPKGVVRFENRFDYFPWTASAPRGCAAGSKRNSASCSAAITSRTGGNCPWSLRTSISATIANHCDRERRKCSSRRGKRKRWSNEARPSPCGRGPLARTQATAKKPESRKPSSAVFGSMQPRCLQCASHAGTSGITESFPARKWRGGAADAETRRSDKTVLNDVSVAHFGNNPIGRPPSNEVSGGSRGGLSLHAASEQLGRERKLFALKSSLRT